MIRDKIVNIAYICLFQLMLLKINPSAVFSSSGYCHVSFFSHGEIKKKILPFLVLKEFKDTFSKFKMPAYGFFKSNHSYNESCSCLQEEKPIRLAAWSEEQNQIQASIITHKHTPQNTTTPPSTSRQGFHR